MKMSSKHKGEADLWVTGVNDRRRMNLEVRKKSAYFSKISDSTQS